MKNFIGRVVGFVLSPATLLLLNLPCIFISIGMGVQNHPSAAGGFSAGFGALAGCLFISAAILFLMALGESNIASATSPPENETEGHLVYGLAVTLPFTIANGIALGFNSYAIGKERKNHISAIIGYVTGGLQTLFGVSGTIMADVGPGMRVHGAANIAIGASTIITGIINQVMVGREESQRINMAAINFVDAAGKSGTGAGFQLTF
jgi:hypothetical protein